jgi:hypothetical protein
MIRNFDADNDFELRPIEPEDLCDYCHALDTEPHQEHCPLFLPRCACGANARRYISGRPVCTKCQPVRDLQVTDQQRKVS